MSRSAWIAGFAFIAITIAADSAAAQPSTEQTVPNKAQSQGQNNDGNKGAPSFSVPVRILAEPEQSEDAKRQQQITSQREIEDLAAQKSMAESAKQTVWLTVLSFALAIVGTGALIYSLLLNRSATKASNEAVKAAIESNRIASANAQTELRAWIAYKEWSLGGIGSPGSVEQFQFTIEWVNIGSTPASNINAVTGEATNRDVFDDEKPIFGPKQSSVVVGPKVNFRTPPVSLSPERVFSSKYNPIYIRSHIKYDTAFDGLGGRESDITLEITYIGRAPIEEVIAGRITTGNFVARPTGRYDKMS